jgi:multidrug efflux pump subunit AcrA (membrane-fusion protein)
VKQRKKSNRLWWGLGASLVLIVTLLSVGRVWQQNRALAAATNDYEIVTVIEGNLTAAVTASGRIVAQRQVSLALPVSGRAQAVPVMVGDRVEAGDLLVQLETAALERALDNARQSLAIQEANLAEVSRAPSALELAAVEAQVASAQAQLDGLPDNVSDAQRAAAEAQLAQAQLSLSNIQRNPTPERLTIVEAQVAQARNALAEAEHNLARAALIAPFAGLVTAVNVAPGEMVSGLVIELVDMDGLLVAVDVDEVDVSALAVGQTAVITLESYPGEEIGGEIKSIAPRANSGAGEAVAYRALISLGETNLSIRIGMTANTRLITAEHNQVLLVPNRAITADRAAGRYYVNRLEIDGAAETAQRVEVSIGLRDGQMTEIRSGLSASDRILVGELPTRSAFGGGGPFGGGPGGGQ